MVIAQNRQLSYYKVGGDCDLRTQNKKANANTSIQAQGCQEETSVLENPQARMGKNQGHRMVLPRKMI